MKNLKKILSVLTLIVLVGSDFLTSISYALDDLLEDSVVVQAENEEAESVENEEENVDEKDSEDAYEDENMGEEELETENSAGDIVEEGTGEVSEIGSGEVEELTEETVEGVTGTIAEELTGDVEEITGMVDENTGTEEEIVIEEIKYNEEPIIGEKSYNDVTVKVEALSGIFPEGTELKIEPIKWGDLSSLKDKLVEEKEEIKEDTTIVAFDITFRYEGEEVQPKNGEKVKVTFDYSRNEDLVKVDKNENQEVKVYHIEDKDEEGNKVAPGEEKVVDVTNKQESVGIGIAVADADSFSVYVVTYGNEDPEFSATLVGDDSARNNFHYKTITISDGEHTYTLMDRNLGARVAWNTGIYAFGTDNSSNYDTADDYYGYYYQWGNNYGFSAKRTQLNVGEVLSNAIPSNYVSNRWNNPYPSGLGNNLRGNTTNTESARQGPCPRGWHVPSVDEWTAIRDAWCVSADKGDLCIYYGQDFANALQMPTAGYRRFQNGNLRYTNRSCTDLWNDCNGYYWSSTSNDGSKANYFFLRSSGTASNNSPYERVNGFPVRCLKNNTDAITLYLNPNGGRVEDGIKDADAQGKVILPTATRNEYNFDGWYDAVDGGNRRGGSGDEITINEDTDLYAHWSEIIPNPIVTFNNGANFTEFEVESGGTLTNEQVQQILNLTHTKATFDGWYKDLEFTQPFDFNTIITEDISLYAKWTCKEGYVTLQGNGGPDMNCFEYETISYEYDGNKHILMDRNLGAQMIGLGREADLKSYGYYYQWGNNYGFGPFTTPITSNTQVDCTNINPSTYSRSTFITGSSDFDWCSPRNDNLWGGNGDGLGNNRGLDAISATVIDRQGPCPRGWHVPSAGERQTLLTYWVSLNGVTRDSGTSYEYRLSNFTRFSDDFKMPLVGRRAYEGAQLGGGGSVYLWSSSPNVDDDLFWLARNFDLSNTDFLPYANSRSYRAYGMPVRCFMNNPKTITFNYNGGEGENFEINVPSGTKVTAPADPTNGNHIFAGWYEGTDDGQTLSATAFDFNEEITQNVDLYAKWVSCENGEIYAPESGKCVARWHELVSLTDDNTTTTVGSDELVDGLPTTITVIENNILELPEGEALSEAEGKELVGDITIDFGGENAKFSRLVKVKIPVEGSSKAYVKVKHVGSTKYNFDGLTTNTGASCDDGDVVSPDDMYHGEYMNVESGYVSIYTCEASDFAAFGLPKVTFEPNNGSGATVVEVENGATVNSGDIPTVTKEGYNFSGWYLTGAESAFDFSGTTITGDITLYAKWQEDEGVTYTVTFDANRGTFANTPAAQTVTDGNYAEEPQTHPELPGYIFTGWWTEPRGGTQWNFANDTVTGNITLYAHWTYKEIFGDLDVYMIDSNGSLIKYVMMDRNLGATGVYNKDFDSQNPNSFGFVYQWGNNWGFERCSGDGTTCHGNNTVNPLKSSDTVQQSVWELYVPSKYTRNVWVTVNPWNDGQSTNANLWGYTSNNLEDKQGPCPDGYHVPTNGEFRNNTDSLYKKWKSAYGYTDNTFGSNEQSVFTKQFLLPLAGHHKKGQLTDLDKGQCADYWTSQPLSNQNSSNVWFCKDGDPNYKSKTLDLVGSSQTNNGSTVRCFKNSTDSANLDIVNGGKKGLITVHKVDGVTTINAIKEPENTDANGTGLIFGGWYTSQNFEPSTMKTGGDTLSASVTTLYAKWDCPDGLVYNSDNECISGVLVRFMDGETEYTRSVVLSGEEVRAPATNPKKAGHIFTGWFEYGVNLPFVFTGTPITGNLDLYAHWEELPETEALITVNYYLKKLDVENNELTGGVIEYSTGVEFIGEIGDTINISGTYLTGIVGYHYDHATVFSGEDEILEDEIYLEGNKEVNMYYIPEQNQFTLNTVQYSNTDGSSVSGMYYYGAKVILSGSSSDDHYLWSGWIGLPEGTPNSAQTEFYMPNRAVTVTSSVREKIYDVYTVTFKNRNGDFLWSGKVVSGEMPTYSGSTPSRSSTEQVVYNFNGWYPELSPVTGNITYTATYTESPRLYTVTLTGTPAGYGTLITGSLLKEYGAAIVISGDKLRVGGTEVTLSGNEGYEFQEWTGTCGKVEKQVCDEHIIYSHSDPIEFTGGNNLIITNPGYDLFSESNYQKDFEISFDIVDQNLSSSVNQATILNVKDEDQENIYPGIAIRKSSSAGKIEITATSNYGKGYKTNKNYSLENLHSIKISRINSILYVSINGSENEQLYDYSGFNAYFTKPIVFGSSYKDEDHLLRPAKVTLSNILIKSVDTCYTGNVYAVTGDCQMTAKFKKVQEYPEITVNHHWMNIGGSGYTIHETEYFSGNIGDEFTAIEKVYTGFTAKLNNDDTIIISGDNNSNVIDLYYDRHRGYFHFLIDPFNSAAITVSGCDNGTCWYGEDVQLTVQEETGYIFNSWGTPTSITLPEGLDRTQKTLSFTMPEINDMQIRWSVFLTAIPYTITYHLNGGEEVEHNQTEYTAGNFVIYVTDPVKTGYNFLGWTGGVIDGPQLSSPTTGLVIVVNDMGNVEVGDREYYANWTPNKYEVTGSVAEGQENMGYLSGSTSTGISLTGLYDYATELVFIAIPELGYVFDYWKNGDTVLSGTDLGDGRNQLTVVVDQILDIIAFFKPSENTPYTVEHYKQNLDQTGYEFVWSGIMYGTTNGLTNATGTDYEGFTLSGDLVGYQTGVKADGSTIVKLYYNRNTYTVTRNMWEGHLNRRKIDKNVPYGTTPIFEWDDEDKYTPKRGREVDTDDIKYDFIFTGWIKSGSTEIIKDLTTQIVTGDVRYIAQYDTGYRYYEVRYHTDEGTGTMEPQSLQLYSSGTLNKNKFIRTGYIFSGWWYEYGDGIEVFYEDEQEINLGVEDDVIKSDAEWEDPLYLDVYAQWKPSTGTKVTVNYYLKDLDADNNVLIDTTTEYATGVEFTGNTDDVVDILSRYGTGIEGYDYSKSIVYGSDFPGGVETGTTTILADGSRVIDMYYVPSIYQFTLNSESHSSTAGSSESTGYYYGANVRLSGDSNDDCFTWSGWTTKGIALSDNTVKQTLFTMPANDVEVTPSVRENTYNIIFNGNGNTSGEMLPMNGVRCTESTGLTLNSFRKIGYHFTGWSKTSGDNIREYTDRQTVSGLSKNDGENINLYAVWDANPVSVHIFHLSETLSGATMRLETGSVLTKVGAFYSGEVKTFSGFTYNPEDSRNKTGIIASYDGSVNEILLYYKRNQYPVRITNEGEGITNEATGSGDYLYEEPVTISVRLFTGWEFVDWTVIEGDLSGVDLSGTTLSFNMPAEQVRISPNLNHILYTVSFDAGLGTAVTESQTYYYDDVLSGLDNAITTRTGYDFSGWYLSGVLYTSGSTMPAENITLTAVWDINKYDVSANVATGDEGYLSGMGNTGISLTGLYDFGESLVVIAIPELGYLFDYWEVNGSVDAETGNQLTIIVDQILDIVAHFKENVGTVTVNYYNMNTGGVYLGVTSTATFTGLVGYTGYATVQPPVGFYLDTTSTVNTGIVISENNAENVINIYYARNKHNITLGYAVAFLNPGSVTVIPTPRESGYYYGEDVHFEAIVSTGYVFKQWRVNGVPVAGGADGVDFIMGDEDVELVVDGDLITYNIDYYTDPGSTDPMNPNPQTYTVLSGEIEIHNPIAEFCNDFLGWTGGTTGDWILTPTTGLVIDSSKGGDRKYYANWERKSYEVELSVDPSSGGTVTGEGTYRCMGEIELHATPNTGYHFVGWYDTGGNIVSSNSMYFFRGPVGSLGTGLTAKFERNQYYITIDKNGSGHFWGESAPSGRYYHGTPITFIASPSYGYKIQKWTKNRQNITTGANNELYTGYILDVTVTETGNYEVYFEPETYNIIYMDSGRVLTGLSPATYTVENHVYSGDLPSITKDGYTFAGWFYEYPWQPEYQIQEIGYVPVDGKSVTILAGWMPIDYNINYHLLTGVEIIPWEEYYPYEFYQSYNIETERTNLPEPQKSGYVFSGWIDQNHNYLTGFGGGMTGNLDLYPTWKSDVMDITVNYYEMDTNGEYPYDPYHEYPTQHHYYTGFTNSTFTVPDYSKTGFSFQYSIYKGNTGYNEPVTFEVSENDSENIINVYYQRARNSLQIYSNNGSKYDVGPNCQSYDGGYTHSCSYYYGTEIAINNYIYEYDEGYSFSGWNIDSEYSLPDDAYLSDEGISFLMPDHPVYIGLETNHILYRLTFTGYEGADVMNADSMYVSLTGENYYRFDSEIELPYLDKPGYNFMGWNSGDYNEWSSYYSSDPYHPIRHMPSHDVELTAEFSPRTDMEYYKYYYFQDTEGTGYSLSGYDRYEDGTTDQRVSSNCTYVEGFTHSRGEPDILYIKATGDNYINCYYDRDEYMVDVIYDDSKLSISGTGYYRYEAPVNLTATVKTGYEFSGFSSEWPEYNTTDSTLSFNVPLGGSYPIYAYAKPIVYSIDYEMNGGHFVPYNWAKTGYTVDGDFDLDIFDADKEGYTFLGWTGGVIGVRELTEPTTGLIIPLGSIGNRKYFANFEATGSNVTVNYYLKKIDSENNVLTGGVDEYLMGIVYTGLTDTVVDIHALYGTGIEGYEYTTAIVYGSDFTDGLETDTTTILGDGSRVIDIYYTPKKYNFTVIQGQNSTTSGTSISTGYYFGAYVILSGDSKDNCFEWNKWGSSDLPDGKNQQHTTFEMPAHNVTVESMVKEKSYNIIFNANGGTGTMSTLSVQCTTGILSPNNFEKDGYTFTGWSRNSNGPVEFTGESDIHRLSTESGGEVTLFAIWDVNWYTVTFDLNGGSLTGDMTDTIDYTIETPAISLENYIPIKTGYNFSGWYKDNDLANSIAGGKTGNYTLTAKWEAIPFTVSFDFASGTVVENQIYYYNDVLSGLDNAITTKTGYNFSGWYLGDVLYTAVSRMPAKNITLTAKWTPRTGVQYQVNHRGENTGNNNYTTLLSSYKMYGTSDSQTVAESGNFAGFSLSGNINQKIIKPDGTTVVDIYYNRNVYSIILDNNGGTGVTEFTGKYQAPLIVPNPSKSGYEFAGWNPELPMTIPSYNYTGIAMWNPSTGEYKVEFYYQLSDGTYPSVATSGVVRTGMTEGTGSVTAADKNPTMSGYSFDSTNTGNVLEGEIVGDGSLVLKVYFKKQFIVRYLTGLYGTFSVDVHSNLDYGVGTPIFRGSTGSHESGYTFLGWNPELTGIVVEDRDYIAQWKADSDTEFKVEYYLQNVEDDGYTFAETGLQTGTTNTTGYADTMKEFTGFIFSGGNQNNITSGVIVGDGSLVLKLYYDRKEYNVTIGEVEHGTMEGGTGSQRYGKRITFTAHPNAGYMISKWLRDGTEILSGGVIWTGEELEIEVNTGMEIGAEFKARDDTLYYVEYYKENLEGGYNVWTGTYSGTTDQEAIASELIFTGFTYDSGNVDNVTTGNIDGDGSRVLVMYYTRNINNVVYVYTGKIPTGQVVPVASGYKYESNVTVAEAPSVSGYNFSWSTGVSSFIMPDEEVTITGTWTANTGTKYAVKHMLQNVEDDEYTQTGENQILIGETDELTDAQANNYKGFIAQAFSQTGIKGDESTVVEIYYDREIYGVTTGESEYGSISGETGNQRYGKVITFTAHPEIGYVVSRWLKNGEGILSGGTIWTGEELEIEVDTGMEIGAEFNARDDTPYYVEYYKENLDGGYDIWTGTYSGTTDQEAVAPELIFTGFTYDSGNVNNITTGNIDGDGSKVLKMYYNRKIYTITWLNEDGTDMDTTTVKYGEIPTHADPTQPADAHYTYKFKGWDPEPTFATGEISYGATYEYIANKYTITWKNDDGSLIDKTMVEYGIIPTHTKPTKAETEDYRYVFAGWDPEVVAVVGDAEYTAVFNAEKKEKSSKGGGMSGGGGRGGNIDNSDNQHGSAQENIDGSGYTGDEVVEVDDTNKDIVPLYKWTYENNVTTMDTLEDADPDGLLTRGHLAKMVVNYMVNVLGRSMPYDITYNCLYWGDDESSWESDEIRDYATKACAFGVMGINMGNNEFLPNNIVTRAEFGTVMSRVLWGDKYDITDTNHRSYFEDHLQALKKDNILTQIANPETRWEIRKWVWLVFRRIVEKYKK